MIISHIEKLDPEVLVDWVVSIDWFIIPEASKKPSSIPFTTSKTATRLTLNLGLLSHLSNGLVDRSDKSGSKEISHCKVVRLRD